MGGYIFPPNKGYGSLLNKGNVHCEISRFFSTLFSMGSWYIAHITWHKDMRVQRMICDGPPRLQFLSIHCVGTSCILEGERFRSDPPTMLVVCTQNHALFDPHVMSKACVGVLPLGGRRSKEQTMTTSLPTPPPPVNTTAPKKVQPSAHLSTC